MESPNRQAVKLLREQRMRRKRVMAFLCMAGVVVIGTVMALRMSGRAMNNMELDCVLSHNLPHQHSEECYYTPPEEGAQKVLVCGMADFVVHKHDPEKCYDKNGNLVCMLQEIEEHVHTDECYQEQRTLSCGMQEGDGGHVHSDGCYGPDRSAEPICGLEESGGHTHTEDCLDEEGQPACGLEEAEGHTHDDSCYPKTLTCGMEEGDGGHIHSEACYSTELILTCGKNEAVLHTHTEECYLHTVDTLDQNQTQELASKGFDAGQVTFMEQSGEAPAEENRVLTADGKPVLKCGKIQVLEHVHDDSCYKLLNAEGELLSQLGSGSEGSGMPGQRSAVYQDATLRATAVYDGEDFPENARISVERVDESEGLRDKQQQLSGILADDELQLKALLKVTVLCSDEGLELSEPVRLTIEPADQGEVTAAAWYCGNGEPEEQGVYFQSAKPEVELLNMTKQENGGFGTEVAPGAVVGIASGPAAESGEENSGDGAGQEAVEPDGEQGAANTVFNISQSFEYEDEDYLMVFHIDGIARFKQGADNAVEPVEPEVSEDAEQEQEQDRQDQEDTEDGTEDAGEAEVGGQGEDAQDVSSSDEALYFAEPSDNADTSEDGGEAEPTATPTPEAVPTPEPVVEPSAQPSSEPVEEAVTIAGDVLRANVLDDPERPLGLKVERMAEDSPVFGMYADNVKIDNTENDLPDPKVLSYNLYYDGMELDISQCAVTLEVKARPQLVRTAALLTDGQGTGEEQQEVPVAIGVMTAAAQEADSDAQEQVFDIPTVGGQTSAPVADEQTQADELIGSCIESEAEIAYAAAPLNRDSDTVMLTIKSKSADSGIMPLSDTDGGNSFEIVTTTASNPKFSIEYYARLDRVEFNPQNTDSKNIVEIIDTNNGGNGNNGKLPINGKDPTISKMGLNTDGSVKTEKELTEIYKKILADGGTPNDPKDDSTFYKRPELSYLLPGDAVEGGYTLEEIRIWSKGKDPEKDQPRKVCTRPINSEKKFVELFQITNREEQKDKEGYIYIEDDDTVRLIYEPKPESNRMFEANFYDYDISSGTYTTDPDKNRYNTAQQGINSSDGYSGTGGKFAFGNANTGTGLDTERFGSNELNKANKNGNGYKGCTFGLVDGIDAGTVTFSSGVSGKKIFGSENVTGKHRYSGDLNNLGFKKNGDTYTLTSATVAGGKGASNLHVFGNPGKYDGVNNDKKIKIWTNNFWPMDNMGENDETIKDPMFGKTPSTSSPAKKRTGGVFPESDDGQDHNSFFGMDFYVDFALSKDYVGPLEYLFFGDDDMWVFITPINEAGNEIGGSTLICDIGGVHSSVGEFVNLWDYIKKGSEGNYRLHFFYTERGASGSTCWMQFTLPSVFHSPTIETDDDYGSLKFRKSVDNVVMDGMTDGKAGEDNTNETFLFHISLSNEKNEPLTNGFSYVKYGKVKEGEEYKDEVVPIYVYDAGGGYRKFDSVIVEGETSAGLTNEAYFTLKKDQWIVLPYLPKGTKYVIEEVGVLDGDEVPKTNPVYENGVWRYKTKAVDRQEHQYEYYIDNVKSNTGVCTGQLPPGNENANIEINFSNTYYSYELPKTGGAGTHVFTAAGALMVMAAGCLLLRKRTK